jgi:lipopolysaccharide export system protein LptA
MKSSLHPALVRSALAALSLGALACASPAAAQFANNCVATYTGHVEALQDDARLRTDLMKVFADVGAKGSKNPAKAGESSSACGDLKRIEAHGSVYYVNPKERVKGDDAAWEAGSDTLVITGDVVAVQDRNVVRGTRMVINNQTGEGHMEGGAKGAGKPGRVRTVIYPNEKPADPNAPAAAPTASAPKAKKSK